MGAPASESTILSKCMQGGMLLAMPAAMVAAGGPVAIWQNHGWVVRTVMVTTTTPSAICFLGLAEDLYRAVDMLVRDRFNGNNWRNNEQLKCEIKRAGGFARAVAFPINGWGVVVKLPVNDHYVYAIPVKIAKQLGDLALRAVINTAVHIFDFMEKTGLNDLIEFTYKITVKPAFKIVKVVVVGAATVIGSALGFARDLIFKK